MSLLEPSCEPLATEGRLRATGVCLRRRQMTKMTRWYSEKHEDPRANVTQFAIAKPSAGRWRVEVQSGSAPVLSLASANGLEDPEIDAKVAGRGGGLCEPICPGVAHGSI